MSLPVRTFSESWYRVATVKASLRPTVRARKQAFRGEDWYVLHDPFNNQFFRLRPEAYRFVARLSPRRSIEEVWKESLELEPDTAPGQEEVIRLLTQLHFANLLYYDRPADSQQFFERYRKRKQREMRSRLMTIMFMRLPLLDPDRLLKAMAPYSRFLFGPIGALLWFITVGAGIKLAIDNADAVLEQAQGVLAPSNLILLYGALVVIKALHEFGHGLTCRYYGGEVHAMGVMLLVFTPLPYMDATASWAFRSRWQRALVGAAGMITELFVAALAVFVWANTGPGTLHSLAYNMMFVASISTVIFNGNPLLKFDGYYILSDLFDLPNLYTRSRQQWAYLAERYLYGAKDADSPAHSPRETGWLTGYGLFSGIYRVVVFTGIILFVADKYLILGMVMVVILVVTWVIIPPAKLIKYLADSPRLSKTRVRAISVTIGLLIGVVMLTAIIPFPNRFRVPGIIEADNFVQVVNDTSGYLAKVVTPSGRHVKRGQPLLVLQDEELDSDIAMAQAQWRQALAMEQKAGSLEGVDSAAVRKRKAAVGVKLHELEARRQSLTVLAKQEGIWIAPRMQDQLGTWQERGSRLGEIVDPSKFRFTAVVPQDEARTLFGSGVEKAEVRLFGQAGTNIEVRTYHITPYQSQRLPSAALSWMAGGEVATAQDDKSGLKTTEPFFEVRAELAIPDGMQLYHGRAGKMRVSLHSEPLLWQWERKIRQLLQKRYQL